MGKKTSALILLFLLCTLAFCGCMAFGFLKADGSFSLTV